jgi:putative phosphoribosyl transferase
MSYLQPYPFWPSKIPGPLSKSGEKPGALRWSMNTGATKDNIIELPELRDKTRVFRDRTQAGEVLAGMLQAFRRTDTIIMAIPSGGLPVAVVIARELELPLEVAVVSKITLPWNTEAGYGAVAFDGSMRLNQELLLHLNLTESQIKEGKDKTLRKVLRRVKSFREDHPFPEVSQKTVILVDDGLASGFTLLVAVEALRKAGARSLMVAVPTGSWNSVLRVSGQVEALYCANIRQGWQFAVADAYRNWVDVEEEEAINIYRTFLKNQTQ